MLNTTRILVLSIAQYANCAEAVIRYPLLQLYITAAALSLVSETMQACDYSHII